MIPSGHEDEKAQQRSQLTVGIVYPGELGAKLGHILRDSGFAVVTTVEGRSERTRRLAQDADLSLLPSLRAVVEQADIVLSTVSPAAALPVAQQYLASCTPGARDQLYVDLNSTSAEIARTLESLLRPRGLDFVDGAIHGLASRLPERGTLYLSGEQAERLEQLFGRALRVKVLGREAGQASTFKMLISGLAKGAVALFAEMCLAGRQAGLLEELIACYRQAYPGIVELAERLLPTYSQHAARRAEEAREVEQTLRTLGLRPCLTGGARVWAEEVARAQLDQSMPTEEAQLPALREMIEALAARGILEQPADEQHPPSRVSSTSRCAEAKVYPSSASLT